MSQKKQEVFRSCSARWGIRSKFATDTKEGLIRLCGLEAYTNKTGGDYGYTLQPEITKRLILRTVKYVFENYGIREDHQPPILLAYEKAPSSDESIAIARSWLENCRACSRHLPTCSRTSEIAKTSY